MIADDTQKLEDAPPGLCPECGEATLVKKESDHYENHGFVHGPAEHFHDEWWECPKCKTTFSEDELDAIYTKRFPDGPVAK